MKSVTKSSPWIASGGTSLSPTKHNPNIYAIICKGSVRLKIFEANISLANIGVQQKGRLSLYNSKYNSKSSINNNINNSSQRQESEDDVQFYAVVQVLGPDDTILQTSITNLYLAPSALSSSSSFPLSPTKNFNLLIGHELDFSSVLSNGVIRITLCKFDRSVYVTLIDSMGNDSSDLSPKELQHFHSLGAGLCIGSIDIPVVRLRGNKPISQWYQLMNRETTEGTSHSLRVEVCFLDDEMPNSEHGDRIFKNNKNREGEVPSFDVLNEELEGNVPPVKVDTSNSNISNAAPNNLGSKSILPVGIIDYVVIIGPNEISSVISFSDNDLSQNAQITKNPIVPLSRNSGFNVIKETLNSYSDVCMLDRFPSADYPECPLPDKMDWFVCPGGGQVISKTVLLSDLETASGSGIDVFKYSISASSDLRPIHSVSSLILMGGQEEGELYGVNLKFFSLIKAAWKVCDLSSFRENIQSKSSNNKKLWWEIGEPLNSRDEVNGDEYNIGSGNNTNTDNSGRAQISVTFTWVEIDLLLLSEYSFIDQLSSILNSLYSYSILPQLLERERNCIEAFKNINSNSTGINSESKSFFDLCPLTITFDSADIGSSNLGCENILLFLIGECPLPVSRLLNVQLRIPKTNIKTSDCYSENLEKCINTNNVISSSNVSDSSQVRAMPNDLSSSLMTSASQSSQSPSPSPSTLNSASTLIRFPSRGVSRDSPLKICPYNLLKLLTRIGPRLLIDLFLVVISEGRLLIHSMDTTFLPQICQCIKVLINPLPWSIVYLPIVPSSIMEVIEAPVPYLLGVSTSALMNYIQSTNTSPSTESSSPGISNYQSRFDVKLTERLEGVTIFNADNLTLYRPHKIRSNKNGNVMGADHFTSSSHGNSTSNSRTIKFPESIDRWLVLSLQHIVDNHSEYSQSIPPLFGNKEQQTTESTIDVNSPIIGSSNNSNNGRNYFTEYLKENPDDNMIKDSAFIAGITIQILFLDIFTYFLKDLPDCILPAGQGWAIFNKAMFMNESIAPTTFLNRHIKKNTENNDIQKGEESQPDLNDDIVDVYRFLHFLTDLNSFHRLVDSFSERNQNDLFPKCIKALNSQKIDIAFLNNFVSDNKSERSEGSVDGISICKNKNTIGAPVGRSIAFMKVIQDCFNEKTVNSTKFSQEIDQICILNHFKFTFKFKSSMSFRSKNRGMYDVCDQSSHSNLENNEDCSNKGFGNHIDSLIDELPHFLLLGLDKLFVYKYMSNCRDQGKKSFYCDELAGENSEIIEKVKNSTTLDEFFSLIIWLRVSIYIKEIDLIPGLTCDESSTNEFDYNLILNFHDLLNERPFSGVSGNSAGANPMMPSPDKFSNDSSSHSIAADQNSDIQIISNQDSADIKKEMPSELTPSNILEELNESNSTSENIAYNDECISMNEDTRAESNSTHDKMSAASNSALGSSSKMATETGGEGDSVALEAITRRRRSTLYVNTNPIMPIHSAVQTSKTTPKKSPLNKIMHLNSSSHNSHNSHISNSSHNNVNAGLDGEVDDDESTLSYHGKSSHSNHSKYLENSKHNTDEGGADMDDAGCSSHVSSHSKFKDGVESTAPDPLLTSKTIKPIFVFDRSIVRSNIYSENEPFTVERLLQKFSEDSKSIWKRFCYANQIDISSVGLDSTKGQLSPTEDRQTFLILNESKSSGNSNSIAEGGSNSSSAYGEKWGHWLGDTVGPNEICVLDFLQFIVSGKKDLVSNDEFETLSNNFKSSLTNHEGCRKFLIQVLLQKFQDKGEVNSDTKLIIFPLHSSAFDELCNMYLDVFTICNDSSDYFTAYELLSSGDIYYHITHNTRENDPLQEEYEVEFLNNKIWNHTLFQSINFWKFIIHSRFDPIEIRQLRDRYSSYPTNDNTCNNSTDYLSFETIAELNFDFEMDLNSKRPKECLDSCGISPVVSSEVIGNLTQDQQIAKSELIKKYNAIVAELLSILSRMRVISRYGFASSTRAFEFVQSIFAEYSIPSNLYQHKVLKFINILWNTNVNAEETSLGFNDSRVSSDGALSPIDASMFDMVSCNSFHCLACNLRKNKSYFSKSVQFRSAADDIKGSDNLIQNLTDCFCNDSILSGDFMSGDSFETVFLSSDASSDELSPAQINNVIRGINSSGKAGKGWGINFFGKKK